jgi:phosphate transport system substrate-binding protein
MNERLKGLLQKVLHAALALITPALLQAQAIKIDGSSTVYPISKKAADDFQKLMQGSITATIGISGTGGGFRNFCLEVSNINNASRPILKHELDLCKKFGVQFIEIPLAYDALTVLVNPQNNWVNSFSIGELKRIWEPAAQSRITHWREIRATWPNRAIKLFAPGADSGTFDYFTEAIVGKSKASRTDYSASEEDNVLVQGVAKERDALWYFGYGYYVQNHKKLRAVPIDGGKGPVAPSVKTVEDGTYQPLSRPLFIYVSKKSLDGAEMRQFIAFYLARASQIVKQLKYVPLPTRGYELAIERVRNGRYGTAFGGKAEIGIRIDMLLKREPQL